MTFPSTGEAYLQRLANIAAAHFELDYVVRACGGADPLQFEVLDPTRIYWNNYELPWLERKIQSNSRDSQGRVRPRTLESETSSPLETTVNEHLLANETDPHLAVCVVENITLNEIQVLGPAYDIQPEAFIDFMRDEDFPNLKRSSSCSTSGTSIEPAPSHTCQTEQLPLRTCQHHIYLTIPARFVVNVDVGKTRWNWIQRSHLYERQRSQRTHLYGRERSGTPYWKGSDEDLEIRTRILYYRNAVLELFLIDSPPYMGLYGRDSSLRRGFRFDDVEGCRPLQVPLNFRRPEFGSTQQPDLQDSIVKFANDSAQRQLRQAVMTCTIPLQHKCNWFARCWSMHAWRRSLAFLDREIQRMSFIEMAEPNELTSKRLHGVREFLSRLAAAAHDGWRLERSRSRTAAETRDRQTIRSALHADALYAFESLLHEDGCDEFNVFLADIARQQDIVVQSFQILLSSLAIKESQAAGDESRRSMEQARKSTILTGVALIYAPLSFVTSIFGMNLKEINGASPAFWSVIAALSVILVVTLGVFKAYMTWSQRSTLRRRGSGSESSGSEILPRGWNPRRLFALTHARVAMRWLKDLKRIARRLQNKRDKRSYSGDLDKPSSVDYRARAARSDSEQRSEYSISNENLDYDTRHGGRP